MHNSISKTYKLDLSIMYTNSDLVILEYTLLFYTADVISLRARRSYIKHLN